MGILRPPMIPIMFFSEGRRGRRFFDADILIIDVIFRLSFCTPVVSGNCCHFRFAATNSEERVL